MTEYEDRLAAGEALAKMLDEANAEIARLREALERVAYYGGVYTCKQRRDIARDALKETTKPQVGEPGPGGGGW